MNSIRHFGFAVSIILLVGCKKSNEGDSSSNAPVKQASVCAFNNSVLNSGDTVNAFQSATVPFGGSCVSEIRECGENGVLSGSYLAETCKVLDPANCAFGTDSILHGMTIPGYKNATVPYGQSCESESRTCSNGVLSGTYAHATCNVGSAASCTINGQTVPNTGTVTEFKDATVPYGQSCVSEVRTCNNGVLTGSYTNASCQVNPPKNCSFNGAAVPSGSSITSYQTDHVPFGYSCSGQAQTRTCTNGVLSGSYTFASCAIDPAANCSFNGAAVLHGQSFLAYSTSSVPYGQTCASQTRTCSNGSLSGSFGSGSCAAAAPANCSFNGQTILHTQSITAYSAAAIAYSHQCASYAQTRTCQNGVLSGWAPFANCAPVSFLPGPNARADLIEIVTGTDGIYTAGSDGVGFTMGTQAFNMPFGVFHSYDEAWFADLNGDGRVDLIYRDNSNNNFGIALNLGYGIWANTASGATGSEVYFADVNGDGGAEMIQFSRASGFLSVYKVGFAPFTLTLTGSYGPLGANDELYFGDINGDHRSDLLVIDRSNANQPQIYNAWSTGANFVFTPGSKIPFDSKWKVVGIAEENGDNRGDLVYLKTDDNSVGISIGNGGWGFTPDPTRWNVPAGADLYLANISGYANSALIFRDRSQASTPNIGILSSNGQHFHLISVEGPIGNNAKLYFGNTKEFLGAPY